MNSKIDGIPVGAPDSVFFAEMIPGVAQAEEKTVATLLVRVPVYGRQVNVDSVCQEVARALYHVSREIKVYGEDGREIVADIS
jgi:hypothetical protein